MASVNNIIDSKIKKEKGISMNMKCFLESERNSIEKFKKYQLPNQYKIIGIGLFILSFILINLIIFTLINPDLKIVFHYGMLIGLFLVSISKEKIEDELVRDIRMQSYSFAFIVAVLYTLAMPLVEYFVDFVIQKEELGLNNLGDFTILWLLLFSQVGYFELLKKIHR